MSGRSGIASRRLLLAFALLPASLGCWEQWSEAWFPQMKWQKAVQAYERVEFEGRVEGFAPPEGAVPVDGVVPSFPQFDPAADALSNPEPASFQSLARGKAVYTANCQACHGPAGMGDGPVSAVRYPNGSYPQAVQAGGPFAGVFPLVTAMARSDGYIYNLIRNGGQRMPSYRRVSDQDRWHLVNYVRHLQRGGQP